MVNVTRAFKRGSQTKGIKNEWFDIEFF